jgi:hypothetical protein
LSDRRPPDPAPPAPRDLSGEEVLRLQRLAGNAAVQRMLASGADQAVGPARVLQREEATDQPGAAPGLGAQAYDWLFGETEGERKDTGESPGTVERWLAWAGIGMADLVAGCVEWFGLEDYDISADLLRHYMSGRGAEYQLDMPQDWAEKIASKYKKKGTRRDVSSYDWGIPDMKNSLGHFDLTIDDIAGGGKLYTVTDKYYFPYKPKDKWEQGRHGFEVDFFGLLPAAVQQQTNAALAALGTWKNPGGFSEKFEVKKIDNKWTFMIPQQFLADHGVDFDLRSSFTVAPDGTVNGDDGSWF